MINFLYQVLGGIVLKKKLLIYILATGLLCSLTGCGEDKELTKYKNQMNDFFNEVESIHNTMNSINPDSETALDELFDCLDDLDTLFANMAELDVPSDFSNVEELADEASENMSLAVENYHNSYSNASYNEYTAATADEYYLRANKRLQYIIDILHGEIPQGDDIIITEEQSE